MGNFHKASLNLSDFPENCLEVVQSRIHLLTPTRLFLLRELLQKLTLLLGLLKFYTKVASRMRLSPMVPNNLFIVEVYWVPKAVKPSLD